MWGLFFWGEFAIFINRPHDGFVNRHWPVNVFFWQPECCSGIVIMWVNWWSFGLVLWNCWWVLFFGLWPEHACKPVPEHGNPCHKEAFEEVPQI